MSKPSIVVEINLTITWPSLLILPYSSKNTATWKPQKYGHIYIVTNA